MRSHKWAGIRPLNNSMKEYVEDVLKTKITVPQAAKYMAMARSKPESLAKIKNKKVRERVTILMEREISNTGYDEWCFCKTFRLKYAV